MSKKEEKNKLKEKEDKKDDTKKKEQIKLRVFEEDDYFEEFEEGKKLYIINLNIILPVNPDYIFMTIIFTSQFCKIAHYKLPIFCYTFRRLFRFFLN